MLADATTNRRAFRRLFGGGLICLTIGALGCSSSPHPRPQTAPIPIHDDPTSGEMSVAELNARERMLYDCDGNGQDDSLDTALGFEEDSNGNHEIDFWDSDTTVLRRVDSDGWKSTAERDQRLYLYRYFAGDRSVIIRYFVPPPGPADLTVR